MTRIDRLTHDAARHSSVGTANPLFHKISMVLYKMDMETRKMDPQMRILDPRGYYIEVLVKGNLDAA